MRILHIADLHLRGITRHDEIRSIINDLCDKASLMQIDRVVIAGDLFHTKLSGITGEYIDLMRWMLSSLASIAFVDIILGNHDFAQNNLTRQDAVSPIVTAMNDDRIKLHKQSSSFEWVPGFNLSVYSLFDVDGYSTIKTEDDKINIALYHGCVRGAMTDEDWELDGECDLSFFDKHDFVILGDIHRMQYLGYKKDKNGIDKPWIGYVGSIAQNNFGEGIDHGFLVWDIRAKDDWDVSWHKLINPKPFVTLDWQGDAYKLLEEAEKFPKNSRFRIKSEQQLLQKEIRGITSVLQKKRKASEVVFKNARTVIIDQNVNRAITNSLDLHSSDTLLKLMKDHSANSEEEFNETERLKSQLSSYISAVPNMEGIVRNTKWNIDKIEFDNLFCYGEGNIVDFNKLDGIVGLFGPNRIGKSSILGTLLYTLFNTTDRGPIKNLNICNERKQYCVSKLYFSTSGEQFLIERQTIKQENKKGVAYAPTSLNFFKINENQEKIDMCGEQRTDTEKNIKSVIGNHEDFLLTTIAAQGDINQFIKFGSTKRRQTLSRFLDLDFFEKIYELANKDKNSFESQINLCRIVEDWDVELATLNLRSQNFLVWINDNEKMLQNLRDKLDSKTTRIKTLQSFETVTEDDVNTQAAVIVELEKTIKSCDEFHKKSIIEKHQIGAEIEKLKNSVLTQEQLTMLQEQFKNANKAQKNLDQIKNDFEKKNVNLSHTKKSLQLLSEVPCGDNFPSCKFIKNAHDNKKITGELEENLAHVKIELDQARMILSSFNQEEIEEKILLSSRSQQKQNELTTQLMKIENLSSQNTHKATQIKKQLDEAKEKLISLKEKKVLSENVELNEITAEVAQLKIELKRLENDKMSFAQQLGKITGDIEKLKYDREIYEELSQKLHLSELIARSFSRKGIPNDIIKTKLPELNAEISRVLNNIVDFTIELENDDTTDSLEIYINYGDSRRMIELGSGMEKTICSIACRAALINISSLPKTDMFVLDESFDALDPASIEACNRLLRALKEHFRLILVISHLDGIKDAVDFSLDIIHDGKDAKIIHV